MLRKHRLYLKKAFERIDKEYRLNKSIEQEFTVKISLDKSIYFITRYTHMQTSHKLSPREFEVAHLICKGLPNKIIAKELDLSIWTVSTYIRRIYDKIGINKRTKLVSYFHKIHHHSDN